MAHENGAPGAATRVKAEAEEIRGRFERGEIGEEVMFKDARRLSGAAAIFGAEARQEATGFESFARARLVQARAEEDARRLAAWTQDQAEASAPRQSSARPAAPRSRIGYLEKPSFARRMATLASPHGFDLSSLQIFLGGYSDTLSLRTVAGSAHSDYEHASHEIEAVLKNAFMTAVTDVAQSPASANQDRVGQVLDRFVARLGQDETYIGYPREMVAELKTLLVHDMSGDGAILRRDLNGWLHAHRYAPITILEQR